jgi:short-subunit dehydrogenase involved in D-alanine esterification of teichoic acids
VKFVAVQLDSLASVREAAKTVLEDNDVGSIDVLINNAGVMACPYGKTVDGFETQFGTNHLSHFLLTNLLMPKLLSASPPARIINLSSTAHIVSPVRFDDLGFKNGEEYVPWLAYGQSKTANILFTVELNRLLGDKGIKSFSMHPGSITSGLQKYVTKEMMVQGMTLCMSSFCSYLLSLFSSSSSSSSPFNPKIQAADTLSTGKSLGKTPNPTHKTLQQGCSTTLRAALDPEMSPEDGVYLVDCQITNEEADLQPYAVDVENAKKLWSVSEELVGEKFGF